MPTPIRTQIIDAVAAALANIGVADVELANPSAEDIAALGTFGADRVAIARDGLPDELPAISVEDRGSVKVSEENFATRWTLNLEIICDVEAADVEDAADVGRELVRKYCMLSALVAQTLQANPQWGGLAALTELGDLDVEIVDGASPRTATTALTVRIQYAERTGDPFTAAN